MLADRQARSELADVIQQSGKANGIATTNLWVDAMNRRWFCVLSPSESQNHTSISNRPVSTITPITQVWCYPQSLVARGFAGALKNAKISLPGYFGVAIKLEGEPVQLPSPWNHFGDGKSAGDILAEGQFQMSQEAGMTMRDSNSELNALLLARPGSRREGNNIFFDDLPSHPQFSMQIRLTDRSLLYARQRQLQLIFGALIAASALAALIGFVAAYRAFRREQQLGELKSNFVSSVSHELRAPIASVRLMAENLEGGKIPESQKQNEYFRFVVQECRRLSSLIENVLDFSRIEQGRKQYEFEPTDLVALAQTTVKLMKPYATEKGVMLKWETFNIQHSTPNIELNVDGRAIQQALVNLIDNAVKHSPKGETVTVDIESRKQKAESRNSDGDLVCLSVADHGPGIPREEQQRIFERFYRFGSELRRETQGVGIGLSIVKHIAEAHGGRVTVESEPGQGSRFTIELPFKK
jgi:signal transduction histidine kinase